ncbi:MAG: efflux RND transporter periplasmic adaptor subunit [Methylococcales bacterium]
MKYRFFNIVLPLCCVLLMACNTHTEEEEAEVTPVAKVQTQPLELTDIADTLTAYGSVIALPSNSKNLSVPYASRIERVYVSNGQTVRAGDPLLTLEPSEDALLSVKQAQQELAAATQEQKLLQGRFQLKLATEHELVTSQLRVDQAKALLQDLTARGSLKTHTLKAEKPGVIAAVNVQQEQRIAAGSPLLQWAEQAQWRIALGIEPSRIGALKTQQVVELALVNRKLEQSVSGVIEAMTQQIDPQSHLVTVIVKPSKQVDFLLNEWVKAHITLSTKNTLVAPRAAVLPDDEGYSVFTVVDKKAVKHTVELGIETDTLVELIDPTLKPQDELVILGNYELTEGMDVEVEVEKP